MLHRLVRVNLEGAMIEDLIKPLIVSMKTVNLGGVLFCNLFDISTVWTVRTCKNKNNKFTHLVVNTRDLFVMQFS